MLTRREIASEPGTLRIAHRSTQGTGRHLKSRWSELEVWYRTQANGRPPFVTVTLGQSTVPGEEVREEVTEAATMRVAGTHFMRDTLPANAVRRDAAEWLAEHAPEERPSYTEKQRTDAIAQLLSAMHAAKSAGEAVDAVAAALGMRREMEEGE